MWVVVGFVVGLAVIVEVDDLRKHYEVTDTLFQLLMDLPAFVALVVMARRQQRASGAEHQAAVTEHLRSERQRAFFANAAHALRTPITIARGHTEMAMQATSDPDVKADLTVVLEELDRLTSAADRNLRLSVAGEVDAQLLRPVDAHELVRTTVERWAPTAQRAWSAETRGETCELLADPDQLTEALDALIENSLLATTPGGSIVVRSEVDADSIVLSVVDDGCGVEWHRSQPAVRAVRAGAPALASESRRNGFGIGSRTRHRHRSRRHRRDGEHTGRGDDSADDPATQQGPTTPATLHWPDPHHLLTIK